VLDPHRIASKQSHHSSFVRSVGFCSTSLRLEFERSRPIHIKMASADVLLAIDEQSQVIKHRITYYLIKSTLPSATHVPAPTTGAAPTPAQAKGAANKPAPAKKAVPAPTPAPAAAASDDDEDFLTSLSDDDDDDGGAAAQALIAKKNAERDAAKRAAKGGPQAKSSLILDIKPEDSDTDLNQLLKSIKAIEMEGLTWGGHEFIPVAYGIRKIRIICVVVDDLISTDDLQESIEATEGVQSTDIHAFNKL